MKALLEKNMRVAMQENLVHSESMSAGSSWKNSCGFAVKGNARRQCDSPSSEWQKQNSIVHR